MSNNSENKLGMRAKTNVARLQRIMAMICFALSAFVFSIPFLGLFGIAGAGIKIAGYQWQPLLQEAFPISVGIFMFGFMLNVSATYFNNKKRYEEGLSKNGTFASPSTHCPVCEGKLNPDNGKCSVCITENSAVNGCMAAAVLIPIGLVVFVVINLGRLLNPF
jgi:hypothetical protein